MPTVVSKMLFNNILEEFPYLNFSVSIRFIFSRALNLEAAGLLGNEFLGIQAMA